MANDKQTLLRLDRLKLSPNDPEGILSYIIHVREKQPWPEVEKFLKSDPEVAVNYASYVLKPNQDKLKPKNQDGRFPEAEPFIMLDAAAAIRYAYEVLGRRWPEAEPEIMKHPSLAVRYAESTIKEDDKDNPNYQNGRWPEAEQNILNSIRDSDNWYDGMQYAKSVVGERWEAFEDLLISAARRSRSFYHINNMIHYCQHVIKGRWLEAEHLIFTSNILDLAFSYARNVLYKYCQDDPTFPGGRYSNEYYLEVALKQPHIAASYATDILKERFTDPMIEYLIAHDKDAEMHYNRTFGLEVNELIRDSTESITRDFDIDDFLHYPSFLLYYCIHVKKSRYYDIEPLLKEYNPHAFAAYKDYIMNNNPEAAAIRLNINAKSDVIKICRQKRNLDFKE